MNIKIYLTNSQQKLIKIKKENKVKKRKFFFLIVFVLLFGIILGFSMDDKTPQVNSNNSKKNESNKKFVGNRGSMQQNDGIGDPHQIFGSPYYTDNFDGANDTTSLKARGYKIYYRGEGPMGIEPIWFQGNSAVFTSFNGPPTGYVASNFNSAVSNNDIDNWLVLPKKAVATGDSIFFYSQSILNSTYPDSLRVLYSAIGDSTPENLSWVELGRFKVNTAGIWQRKGFRAPSTGANARYAIRYSMVNAGPKGTNSIYTGIDALTLEGPALANDVGTLSISSPSGNVAVTSPAQAPKATFKNFGTVNQVNIPVTYKITGPVNYTSNKTIASLTSGETQQIIFDSSFIPTVGTYNVSVYTSLVPDGYRLNDTLKSTFNVYNPNFGSGADYFFANSTPGASGAPSQPEFCWKDTTGSISLISNQINKAPGLLTGTLDDGYFRLGNILGPGKKIRFFGVDYDSVFIGTNGLIGFTNVSNLSLFSGAPGSNSRPAFYPLWSDYSFDYNLSTNNRLSYKVINGFQLLITYDRAHLFGGDFSEYVSFQVVIDILENSFPENSRLLVQYADGTDERTGGDYLLHYDNNDLASSTLVGLQNAPGSAELVYRYTNPSTITSGPLFSVSPVAIQFGHDPSKLNSSCSSIVLNLTASLEAITPNPPPSSNSSDTVTVLLRKNTPPYEIDDGSKGVLSNAGFVALNFTKIEVGRVLYIVVRHRNSIETWSSSAISFTTPNDIISYDFTDNVNKAYGNNMVTIAGVASIYTGDVNQDGIVDGSDLGLIDNDVFNFGSGYISTDLNNDGIVDGTDASYGENNAYNFVGLVRP